MQNENWKSDFTQLIKFWGVKLPKKLSVPLGPSLTTEKSNALNRQFQSVSSPKSPERLSSLAHRKLQELNDQGCNLPFQSSPYSQMPEIQISVKGIEKLLKSLNQTWCQLLWNVMNYITITFKVFALYNNYPIFEIVMNYITITSPK